MKNFVKHIQNINARHMLWANKDTLIIGVSGGPDSMCLFDVFTKIAKKENLSLVIAHVNYGLRGEDSKKDQRLVEKTAKKHGVICEVLNCSDFIGSNENDWRNIRYDFFKKLKYKHNAQSIVVAHNKNDQAETLLLHLLRGTGLQGLTGMQVRSVNNIIRPMLFVERGDVLKYLVENDIKYNIDITNTDSTFMRNKIRNKLIPYLEENFNPNVVDTLAKTTQILADDYDFLQRQNKIFWEYNDKKNIIKFSASEFIKQHISQQHWALRTMILQVNKSTQNIESGFIEEMQKILISKKNKNQKITGKNLKMLRYGDIVELTCLAKIS